MADLAEVGAVDKTTMREFDRLCLAKAVKLAAQEIRGGQWLDAKNEQVLSHPAAVRNCF